MKKPLILLLLAVLLFFVLPIPRKTIVMCIMAPCPPQYSITTPYKFLRDTVQEKKSLQKSRDVTNKQTWVVIKLGGTEKFGNKEIVIHSIDNLYYRKYQIDGKFVTIIPQQNPGDKEETDSLTIILNPGSYQVEQYLNNKIIKTIPVIASDSTDASSNIVHLDIIY